MRRLALLALVAFPTGVDAQIPGMEDEEMSPIYWIDVWYPKVYFTPTEGLGGGFFFAIQQPPTSDEWARAAPYRKAYSLDVLATTQGSRFVKLAANFPGASEAWRFKARLTFQRRARDNYFGIGNETIYETANITDTQPDYYRAVHDRYSLRTDVHRRITDGVRLVAGATVERWRISSPEGPSLVAADSVAGVDGRIGVATTEGAFRLGLVFDTRDDNVHPNNGVLIDALLAVADSSLFGDLSYTQFAFSARGYLTATPRIQLAGRLAGRIISGNPALGSYYLVENSEERYEALGGPGSHRGVLYNRLLGRDVLLSNFDVRYLLYGMPGIYRITLLGFLDAGRVFQNESFRITTEGFLVGGGLGLVGQIGRAGVIGATVGYSRDGFAPAVHTKWTF
ncbi:MAG: outer membrane protein assembly factor [Gemmatimonadota bacterium]|nr:outer membrane protein assembly factor [Gemmatimonadota bacterium]